jgi:hypothetical protein
MIKNLIIHIGDRKTGSTSIQAALANNSLTCSSASIVYPVNQSKINHISLARAIGRRGSGCVQRGQALRKRLQTSNADYAVISSEDFEEVQPEYLNQFINTFLPEFRDSMRIIGYIRPHAERIVSSFCERSKIGAQASSLPDLHLRFLRSGLLQYAPRMQAWREVFGERVLFKPFIPTLLNGQDVVLDFYNFMLGGMDFQINAPKHLNESLFLEDIVILREAHACLRKIFGDTIKQSTLNAFGRRMAYVLSSSRASGTKVSLHRKLFEDIIQIYRNDAETIDRQFFSESPMLNALIGHRDKVVDDEQSLSISDYYSPETIRQISCWSEFIGRLIISNQEHFIANLVRPEFFSREIHQG